MEERLKKFEYFLKEVLRYVDSGPFADYPRSVEEFFEGKYDDLTLAMTSLMFILWERKIMNEDQLSDLHWSYYYIDGDPDNFKPGKLVVTISRYPDFWLAFVGKIKENTRDVQIVFFGKIEVPQKPQDLEFLDAQTLLP